MKLLHTILVLIYLGIAINIDVEASTRRYEALQSVSGKLESEMQVLISKKSKNLDLARTSNIRLRLRPEDLYRSKNTSSSFKVNAYEIKNGQRVFISSQAITLLKSNSNSKIISVDLGYFDKMKKDIELDVFDTNNNHAASYATEVTAYNKDKQIKQKKKLNLADCDNSEFGQCQLDYLLSNISFELKPIKSMSTRIVKADDGHYKVIIPMQKSYTRSRSRRFRNKRQKISSPDTKQTHAISENQTREKRHYRKAARALSLEKLASS